MCQFSDSGAPSLGSQHGMKFAYSALEGALPAIVDEVAQCGLHLVPEALAHGAGCSQDVWRSPSGQF